MKPDQIKIGHTYEAKRPKCVGVIEKYYDDRQVLWISPERDLVQYDSPTIGFGKNYKTVKMEAFCKWAGRNCNSDMPRGEWRNYPWRQDTKDVKFLLEMINMVESTSEEDWIVDVVRSKDGKRNCFFGHLFQYYSDLKDEKFANKMWDRFESIWATTFMIFPINDGENPKYQQPTPRQRVLQYLKDLRNGVEESILDMIHGIG